MHTSTSAAVLLIGNELLSGSIQDCNLQHIAKTLEKQGIETMECRIVPDVESEIVRAITTLRKRFDFVFTTGGVGPTHDDITSDSIAAAFSVPNVLQPQVDNMLTSYFQKKDSEYTTAARRMAHAPQGAEIIPSSESIIPCYRIENVFVLAGVPRIMKLMLNDCLKFLPDGQAMLSVEVHANISEGVIANVLGEIQKAHPSVNIGSYPQEKGSTRSAYQVVFVIRGKDQTTLESVQHKIYQSCLDHGVTAEIT